MNAEWCHYFIAPIYARNARGLGRDFYAPDLDTAFALARAQWPGAISWSVR